MDPNLWVDKEINALMEKVELYAEPAARGERLHMALVTIIFSK